MFNKVFRSLKSIVLALLIMLAVAVFMALLVWSKGLLFLLLIFVALVLGIYESLSEKEGK